MKKYFFIAIVLSFIFLSALTYNAHAAISLVETQVCSTCTSSTVTFNTPTTAGELIVLEAYTGANSTPITAPTDNKGDTYLKAYDNIIAGFDFSLWYAYNVPAGVTVASTTQGAGNNAQVLSFIAAHYRGISSADPLDIASSTISNPPSPWASPSITTHQTDELLVGQDFYASDPLTLTGNWIARATSTDNADNFHMVYGDQIVSSTQNSISYTGTGGGSGNYLGIAAFKAGIADVVPPSIAWVAPSSNATVSSTVTLTASSTDNVSVASVAFYEGALGSTLASSTLIGSTSTPSGNLYSIPWNTTSLSNGSTTLWALSTDTSNNTTSVAMTVNIENAPQISLFTASPTSLDVGSPTNFSWNAIGASSVTITGSNISFSTSTASGTASFTPTVTGISTYTLSANNVNGTSTASVSLNILPLGASFDNFNRADGLLGSNWSSTVDGGMSIVSDQVIGSGSGGNSGDMWIGSGITSDQYSEIELTTTPLTGDQWIGPTVRDQVNGDIYLGMYYENSGSPQLRVYKRISGGFSQLGTSYDCGSLTAGTVLKLTAVGNTIVFSENGVPEISTTDSDLSGGSPGILTNAAVTADNWSGGSIVPLSATWISPLLNAVVSSTVTLVASSTDGTIISSVAFYHGAFGSSLTSSTLIASTTLPSSTLYSVSWNTSSSANGSTTLWVFASDSSNNTSTASTTVNVQNPAMLSVTTSSSLMFTAIYPSPATSSQSVMIANTGGASTTLNWTATSTQTWLTFGASSGSLAQNATTSLKLIVTPNTLFPGIYNATATIADVNALGSPQIFSVTYTITYDQFNPASTSFNFTLYGISGNTASRELDFQYNNPDPSSSVNWTTSSTQSWLSMSPSTGTIFGQTTGSTTFVVNTTGLSPGTYNGFGSISDGIVSAPYSVTLNVIPQAILTATTTFSLNFTSPQGSTVPVGATFLITNGAASSTSLLHWTVSADQPWLSLQPSSGTLVGGSGIPSLALADPTGLIVGTYTSTITVSGGGYGVASGSPQTVPFMFTILAPVTNMPTTHPMVGVAAGYAPSLPPSHPSVSNVVTTTPPPAPVTVSSVDGGGNNSLNSGSIISNSPGGQSMHHVSSTSSVLATISMGENACVAAMNAFHPMSTIWPGVVQRNVAGLQKVLNTLGFSIASSGPGSFGNETDYFGLRTIHAVQQFQSAHGIVSFGAPLSTGFGVVGPGTRAVLESAVKRCAG